MVKRIIVSIALPPGVQAGDFTIRVAREGQYLELNVKSPTSLMDIPLMKKSLKMLHRMLNKT